MKRIYVKFFGFSETELHALETVFSLSGADGLGYSAWTPEAAETQEAPDVLLIEGDSWEAVLALANPSYDGVKLIWVGEDAPANAWRVLPAPVKWSAVVHAMDEEFTPVTSAALSMDLDLAHEDELTVLLDENEDTQPMDLDGADSPAAPRRVLVVDAGREERLYLRAKLASAGLYDVDEAASGVEAVEYLRQRAYHLVTIDLGLIDVDSWQLVKLVDLARPAIAHLFVTGTAPGWKQGWRARLSGAQVYLQKPLDPVQLKKLLQKV